MALEWYWEEGKVRFCRKRGARRRRRGLSHARWRRRRSRVSGGRRERVAFDRREAASTEPWH